MAAVRAHIPHAVPGRLRVKLSGSDRQVREVLHAVEQQYQDRAGVNVVQTDPRTGSALVLFDPEELDLETAVTLLREAHSVLAELVPPALLATVDGSASAVAGAVRERFAGADRTVLRATRGAVDLRMLLPIALAGLSVRQLLRSGPMIKTMPWYVLGYYAFDSFLKLHGQPVSGPVALVAEDPA